MNRAVFVIVVVNLASTAWALDASPGFAYPPARRVEQVDEYHGVKVSDPYRWLENADSAETKAWVQAENKLTFGYLESIPTREPIRKRLTQLSDFERFDPPIRKGGKYFYGRNTGLQNQNVLYVADSLQGEPRVLLDPNALSKDGTVALTGMSPSDDGRFLAYGLSTAGSDWQEWRIRDVTTGQDLPDRLKWIKWRTGAWTHDNRGFFYGRFPQPKPGEELTVTTYDHKLYYHLLGKPQSEDVLIYEKPEHKEWAFVPTVSTNGRFLIIDVNEGDELDNRVLYKDMQDPGHPVLDAQQAPVIELLMAADAHYEFLDAEGSFLFMTNKDAPRGRVIAVDKSKPDSANWREIVAQAAEPLQDIRVIGHRFVGQYLKDAHSLVRVFGLDGKLEREIELPGLGTASGFAGEPGLPETFYAFSSFTMASAVYRCDVSTGVSTIFRKPEVPFNTADYETKQVFYESKDGTKVPMFISHRKGIRLDGQNATYLYGYGGFNAAITPRFSQSYLVWMELGGIVAVANLRGGSEYGSEWHDAGRRLKKQNVFDDFIAAGEWLIKNRYTSTPKLAIGGASNGGLLVGACLTQRPDLFGAALPDVGVMDMLRFPLWTEGWGWVTDYGSPDNPQEFKALYAYSPLHNIKPGTKYPPTLITTSDHDDRVVPGHSFKFTAALQAAQAGDAPILIRVETQAGHGAGKPTSKKIEEAADRWAFLTRVLKMEPPAGR